LLINKKLLSPKLLPILHNFCISTI